MKVKVFTERASGSSTLETAMNKWLEANPAISIKHICQSQSQLPFESGGGMLHYSTVITVNVFYTD